MSAHAFVHVDVDNLWAIAECYGIEITPDQENFVLQEALPTFSRIFSKRGIQATFFIVGRDLETSANVSLLNDLHQFGHAFANHSYSHALNFRALDAEQLRFEITRADELLRDRLDVVPLGFRAPGYGISPALIERLSESDYLYDSSIMPSPYGFVFRFLDARICKGGDGGSEVKKTQFPVFADAKAPLTPYRVSSDSIRCASPALQIWEFPVAASPLLRLPFQAGVCMRLGRRYFDRLLNAFKTSGTTPFIFLLHAADLCDFRKLDHPFFRNSAFFGQPIEEKVAAIEYFLDQIREDFGVGLTENWLKRQIEQS